MVAFPFGGEMAADLLPVGELVAALMPARPELLELLRVRRWSVSAARVSLKLAMSSTRPMALASAAIKMPASVARTASTGMPRALATWAVNWS